jgi:hypothetical protein
VHKRIGYTFYVGYGFPEIKEIRDTRILQKYGKIRNVLCQTKANLIIDYLKRQVS